MADDLYQLELLSLVAKVTQEIVNYTGINDKTLAEFVISLHDESSSCNDFKQKLENSGADFPKSFVENLDRLILNMHPKHKKAKSNGITNGSQKGSNVDEGDKKRRMFPGLALPDQDWQPSVEKDVFMKEVDDMMAELEGVQKKKAKLDIANEEQVERRQRERSRSRSPRRRSPSPPRGRREDRYDSRRRGHAQLDERPVLYKIYTGRVSGLKDFGAFIQLEGIAGRAEGRHLTYYWKQRRLTELQVLYTYRPFNKADGLTLLRTC